MRLGFVIGFLAGAGVASLIAAKQAEAPAETAEGVVVTAAEQPVARVEVRQGGLKGLIAALKEQARQARIAGEEAAAAKEAEMRRAYEETLRQAHR